MALGGGRTLAVEASESTAVLRVQSPNAGERLAIEIRFEADGPVVRATALALEVEAPATSFRCDRFEVDARQGIELRSGGDLALRAAGNAKVEGASVAVEAERGDVQIRANDDVQLLGELILLNCDRTPPTPAWMGDHEGAAVTVPPSSESGDEAVLAALRGSATHAAGEWNAKP